MIDHTELEKLAFDRAIDKLAALRAISILDEMEKEAKAKDILLKLKDPGVLGERVRSLREGHASAKSIAKSRKSMATKAPIMSIPERYNILAEKVLNRGMKGVGKTKQFKGNVGMPRKGAKPIPVR